MELLTQKVLLQRSSSPGGSGGSTPPLSRASSTSSSSTATQTQSQDGNALLPLTNNNNHDHYHHTHIIPKQSLRQRVAAPRGTDDDIGGESSNSESDEEMSKYNNTPSSTQPSPSVLRSVLGASPFLMGPHNIFSSDVNNNSSTPSRTRKESGDHIITDENTSSTPVSTPNNKSNKLIYRRNNIGNRVVEGSAPQCSSPLMIPLSPAYDSSIDIENNESSTTSLALALGSSDETIPLRTRTTPTNNKKQRRKYAFQLRSRENVIIHFLLELRMLQVDILFVLFTIFYQFFHSSITNIAYYQHAQLNAANRIPLRDIAFDYLPQLDGELWMISEYICYTLLGIAITCIVSNLVVRWSAPHGRPIYCMQIVRRLGLTLIVCQTLRMISFLVTTLPGASRQCRYAVPESGLTSDEMLSGPAPDEGNPAGWAPPTELNDIIFRVDASNGCGDLMFSSHTIYTMSFVCIVFRYFNFKWLKLIMALLQIAIVPFILAARKHYSVDVFTALYVTPLVFEFMRTYFPDRDTSADLAKYYGIRFYLSEEGNDTFSYVSSIWGREFYVDSDHLPIDIRKAKGLPLSMGKDKESTSSRSVAIV